MSRSKIYPTFHYYPVALKEESRRIQEKYKNADQVPQSLTIIKLPKLLEKIRALSDVIPDIIAFAKTLKSIDINILATEFPYETENRSTVRKIKIILVERYNRIVGRRFWSHFQILPYNHEVTEILSHAFTVEEASYLALNTRIRHHYNNIFSSHYIMDQLVDRLGKERRVLADSFSEWKISVDGRLSDELWILLLETFIKEEWFVNVQGVETIVAKMDNISNAQYKKVLNRYLLSRNFQQYHIELLKQSIQRLGDPRESLYRWNDISENAIESVKKWLFKIELFEFLDYDRFDYWEKYIHKVTDLKVVEDPPVAAMYFNDFVVVEFAKIGNAAYFYDAKGFSKHLAATLKAYVPVERLKDRKADFYIHKLSHAGSWRSRFDDYMSHYMHGNFWYRH